MQNVPGQVPQIAPITFDHNRHHSQFPVQSLNSSSCQLKTQIHVQRSTVRRALHAHQRKGLVLGGNADS